MTKRLAASVSLILVALALYPPYINRVMNGADAARRCRRITRVESPR